MIRDHVEIVLPEFLIFKLDEFNGHDMIWRFWFSDRQEQTLVLYQLLVWIFIGQMG